MLASGELTRPLDIFDLLLHAALGALDAETAAPTRTDRKRRVSGRRSLLFVYNADSGCSIHWRISATSCFRHRPTNVPLCALTHGYFRERTQWRDFVASLDCDCRFCTAISSPPYPQESTPLPAVHAERGLPTCCADADSIAACTDLPEPATAAAGAAAGSVRGHGTGRDMIRWRPPNFIFLN